LSLPKGLVELWMEEPGFQGDYEIPDEVDVKIECGCKFEEIEGYDPLGKAHREILKGNIAKAIEVLGEDRKTARAHYKKRHLDMLIATLKGGDIEGAKHRIYGLSSEPSSCYFQIKGM